MTFARKKCILLRTMNCEYCRITNSQEENDPIIKSLKAVEGKDVQLFICAPRSNEHVIFLCPYPESDKANCPLTMSNNHVPQNQENIRYI